MDLANLAMISDNIKRPHDRYNGLEELRLFREAWDHTDQFQREKWREVMQKEFFDMKKCHV